MRPGSLSLLCVVWAAGVSAGEVAIGPRTLRIPDGYEIELVAGPPLVERPIAVSRDERGRLYVTDSAGMSDRADKQRELKPHRVRRLEDSDGDGRYDASVVFADGMMFPEGCLWYEGSLYVAAPPEIWKLTDADGDGRAETREIWFDGKTLTGCANDLHGPYLGPDGWFYWCKGAFAEQRHIVHGRPFVTRASHIFRSRPDATGIEPVLTGGMDNPVNVAFLSAGERMLSCTFFQFPEAGHRDGLIHAIYGGVYGKRHDSIYEHRQTGDVMPVLVHEGAAAPCGLVAGSAWLFDGQHADDLFACYFNLHKVVRHRLVPDGATFRTEDEDFVACDHPDFHPTDVFEDADGSLLVVDTGGWYKVCCPTSQLAKPDVLGGIYRVRKAGTKPPDDPLGLKLDWKYASQEELAGRLGDSRLFVQRRASQQLRRQGAPAIAPLRALVEGRAPPSVKREALWTLAGLDLPAAREATRVGLRDADVGVLRVAAQSASLWRDAAALDRLMELLAHDDAGVARLAAEAIGRIGNRRAVPALLDAIERLGAFPPDESGAPRDSAPRIREHSLIYALIEIADPAATAAGRSSSSAPVRRAALVALDQMENGGLASGDVVPLLSQSDPVLRNTAVWIVSHRPEWGPELVAFLRGRLTQLPTGNAERRELSQLLARLAKSPAIQELLTAAIRDGSPDPRRIALQAMTDAGLRVTPPAWLDELSRFLATASADDLPAAVVAARLLPLPKEGHASLKSALLDVGRREDVPLEVRLDALLAAGPFGKVEPALFETLVRAAGGDESFGVRGAAATILGTASLASDQQRALLATVHTAGPLELPKLLSAFERGASDELGRELVETLGAAGGVSGLRHDLVSKLLEKYSPAVREAAAPLLARLNASAAEQAELLTRLEAELPPGDVRRGHEVFLGKKAACINCHTLGYHGGRLGPDLTNIGKARNERDLLEAIVFPSASLVRGYEPVIVELTDGRVVTGIIAKESRDEIVIAIDHQKTQHVARDAIEEIRPSPVSLMPQGMLTALTRQELADLVAFLKTSQR